MSYKQASLQGCEGGCASVFLQAPKHGSRHALLLQPHLWGRWEGPGHLSSPEGPSTPLPPRGATGLTVGLQVHLVLVVVLAQLDLLRVGLLRQLGQLLPRRVTPGRGSHCSGGLTTSSLPGPSL